MADFPEELSRRTLIKAGLTGAIGSLTKVSAFADGTQNTQRMIPMNVQRSDLTNLTLREAATLIRMKKVSPVELTKACLARIESLNPTLNCFITVTSESALAQARAAEADVTKGKWRGPLHGVPIALKDLFDTAGVKTTAGSGVFKDRIPKEDAEVVRRLKDAGAVLLGKTNMQEFAFGGS
jgi:aspartyl-tRNA(Asn)/glutamyl-tRNA(Gln) amidotransferase subunit A